MNSSSDSTHSSIADHRLIRELGRGGMGVVYEAEFQGQRRALKMLLKQEPALQQRFLREAQAVAAVDAHPNIVKVFKYGVESQRPYISFEFVEGQSLEDELKTRGPFSLPEALEVLTPILRALAHVHAHGITHRDLKPANILKRQRDGQYLLADFGLAQFTHKEALTVTGELLGTPQYMAPEQIDTRRADYGPWTDIWAMAVILYELLTGEVLFAGDSLVEISAQIFSFGEHRVGSAVRNFRGPIDRDFQEIWKRCLRVDVEQRFRSADELLEAIEKWQAGFRPSRQRPLKRLALASVILVVALAAVLLWLDRSARRAELESLERRLWTAYKSAHTDSRDVFIRGLLGQPRPKTDKLEAFESTWLEAVKNPAVHDRAELRKRRFKLLFALQQCAFDLPPQSPLKSDSETLKEFLEQVQGFGDYQQWLDFSRQQGRQTLKRIFTEADRKALDATQMLRSARARDDLDQAQQSVSELLSLLGPQDWLLQLTEDLKRGHLARQCANLKITERRLHDLFEARLAHVTEPQVWFRRLNQDFKSLVPESPSAQLQRVRELTQLRSRIVWLSQFFPKIQAPPLSRELWDQLIKQEAQADNPQPAFILAIKRWQDGHRPLPEGQTVLDMQKWIGALEYNRQWHSKAQRAKLYDQKLELFSEAMKIGLFVNLTSRQIGFFQSLGCIDRMLERSPKAPESLFWKAFSWQCQRDQNGQRRASQLKRAYDMYRQARAHPLAQAQIYKIIDYQCQSCLSSLKSEMDTYAQKQSCQLQIKALCLKIIEDESPFALRNFSRFLEIYLAQPAGFDRDRARDFLKRYKAELDGFKKAYESKQFYQAQRQQFVLLMSRIDYPEKLSYYERHYVSNLHCFYTRTGRYEKTLKRFANSDEWCVPLNTSYYLSFHEAHLYKLADQLKASKLSGAEATLKSAKRYYRLAKRFGLRTKVQKDVEAQLQQADEQIKEFKSPK